MPKEIEPDSNTALLDHFNGTTLGTAFGTLSYGGSLPLLKQAVDLRKGIYIKYVLPCWYRWDGIHKWDRNEAAPGILTQGTIEMWIKPRQYSIGILNLNWQDAVVCPPAGHIGGIDLTAEGKLRWGVWGGYCHKPGPVGKSTIPLNEWTHIAVSWSPNGTKLYVNGSVDAHTPENVWPAFLERVFVYLNRWGEQDLGFVDEFHISKVARTDEEIRSRVRIPKIQIKETSKIEVYIDGKLLDYRPQSMIDAFERAVNELLGDAREAKIIETVNVTKKPTE
jgi:hypothetical protein